MSCKHTRIILHHQKAEVNFLIAHATKVAPPPNHNNKEMRRVPIPVAPSEYAHSSRV